MARPLFAAALLLTVTFWGRIFAPEPDPSYNPVGIEVEPFTLSERSGKTVSLKDLRGKVWVAHFFYSQCQGPCTKTLPAMRELQQTFAGKPDVMLVSISVNPEGDTPELLRRYADDQGADPEQWMFLTGSEAEVHAVIQHSFRHHAGRSQKSTSPGDAFEHPDRLLVIDRDGVIDGYVDGKASDAADVVTRHVRAVAARKYVLPAVNAALNALCAALLVMGFLAIRGHLERLHIACMLTALGVSALFLGCYLYFHIAVQGGAHTVFRGEGWVAWTYYAILISHTILAIVIAPLALFVAYQGLRDHRLRHVRIARWTLPFWLYVSITGVVVYWLLYQVYPPY
jgi:protein SCO1/2/putative membrane protein